MKATSILIVVLSIAIGVGRFFVPGHDLSWPGTYEAFAHIWVGYLIAVGCHSKNDAALRWLAVGALAAIILLEVVMFALR